MRESLAMLSAEGRVRTAKGVGTLVLNLPVPRHLIRFDPTGPWADLTTVDEATGKRGAADAHGPLTHEVRCGAGISSTDDRASLKTPNLGSVVLYVAVITHAADRRGLLLDTLRCNAAEAQITI